ncbi:hypothetical protein M406DRAFT_280772 [Cryphonectria parasitica EP155]|uniref:Uncharacterized protein n=1 Tax=Cryphonectria parasitica (strain ATCC 38755 / EP155) TaxID=660469 RepID=A0A9P4XXB2_CRYP1|nr:uncharacterized protein M406DRAFT_280772 [Cryphonectria parasitica EP155]KAF3762623.1 hypothetical protein M406DRAFT_280772 [Cryphonectria parasitica EP155]
MAVQDDLATLFARNMSLAAAAAATAAPPPQSQPPSAPEHTDPNRIVYISQHYTHSAHIAPTPAAVDDDEPMVQQRSASEPAAGPADLELLLRSAGVDTAALTLPQVELFRHADDAQRTRLVQLWTICPPTISSNSINNHLGLVSWGGATSLEQEEALARRRYDEATQSQHPVVPPVAAPEVVMSLDGTEVVDAGLSNSPSSSVQSSDSRWHPVAHAHGYMEPYMQSGYEELARREYDPAARKPALDPVYRASGGMLDWERQQWMENQYGSFVGGWRDDEEML